MRWFNTNFCVNCHKNLSFGEVMGSHGRCPYCGHKGQDAGTVVAVYEKAARRVAPWWKFWDDRVEFKGKAITGAGPKPPM